MLFKQIHLNGIKAGETSLAFRKWKRASVKNGSLIKTAVGQIEILDIKEITRDTITNADATKAGFKDLDALLAHLDSIRSGNLYRISLRYHSPDPRIRLRQTTKLADEEFEKIKEKLKRLDTYSNNGNWTLKVLQMIQKNPHKRALDLSRKLHLEKDWLKPNIRKLKNLGLTISHEVGYSISPLGKEVLRRLKEGR
jgi:hypothetical protein